jgi:hypothetical protein
MPGVKRFEPNSSPSVAIRDELGQPTENEMKNGRKRKLEGKGRAKF